MKKLTNITTLLLFSCTIGLSQTQMNNWYLGPQKIDMTVSSPSPAQITPVYGATAAAMANHLANCFYDNYTSPTVHGNLLFYIANATVYDYNNTVIGTLPTATNSGSAEVAIVPFGTNSSNPCQRKYNIFTVSGGVNTPVALWQTVLDMNSYSLSDPVPVDVASFQVEFGAVAVSKVYFKVISGGATKVYRNLYFLAGSGVPVTTAGQIDKLEINNDGSVSTSVPLYPNPSLGVTNANAGSEVFSKELDLSPDGKWLAWASYAQVNDPGSPTPQFRYHFVALDASGDLDVANYGTANVYQRFNINGANYNVNAAGFRGVEFDPSSSKLFMGAGTDGIYYTNIAIPFAGSFTQVGFSNGTATSSFGFSQIELANNGNMYASSGNTTGNNIGAFDPTNGSPFIDPLYSFPFNNPPKDVYNLGGVNQNSTLYTLPDQIDGQDYSAIVPLPITPLVATAYNCGISSTTTAIWSNGTTVNNPWGTSGSVQVISELHITGNSNLIIDGMTFKFSPQAKVVIDQGSLLTLNNSTFTSDYLTHPCNERYTWKGVQVLGNTNVPQKNIPGGQGQLVLNYSTIENAECGVMTWDRILLGYAGGIVKASNSTFFHNNKIDIEFMPYQNFMIISSGTHLNLGNSSNFKNCNFNTDALYPFSAAPIHVLINGCNGISFKGCTFQVANASQLNTLPSIGIKALDGGFSVTYSTFVNLWHGIDAARVNKNRAFRVYKSSFYNNQTGIAANNINNIAIQSCNASTSNGFIVGGNQNPNASIQVGISLNKCSGYTVEENQFNSTGTAINYGIQVSNSGSADNQIYRNGFTGMNYGNVSAGINLNNSEPSVSGLQYLCNTNQANTYCDFYIGKASTLFGIRTTQGTNNIPAGNTFSHYGSSSNITDIKNVASTFNYYYWSNSTSQTPLYYSSPNVIITPATVQNTCPSHINNQVILAKLSEAEIQDLNANYDSAETAYLNLLYAYNQLLDGGCTNTLLTQIQQSWAADAWQLRDVLLAQSPYLSQDVLRETAQQNSLPQAMLLAVCMANPDATKDEEFLSYLQNEMPNPLPQYMIDMIIASWNTITTRTTLESALADYSSVMATTSDKLLSDLYFRTDVENDSIIPLETDTINYNDTIRYWLNRVQTLTAKYDLIENYFDANELTTAQYILDSMPYNFTMSADQLEAYNDYVYFFNFRKTLLASGQTMADLDSAQIQYLVNFTADGDNYAKGLAQNALCFYYNICREENYDLEITGNRMMNNTSTVTNKTNAVIVAPNPCATYATFSYSVPMLNDKATLTITDITGKMVKQFVLENNEGQQIWDTRDISKGIYFYQLKGGNTIIAKGKVAVK